MPRATAFPLILTVLTCRLVFAAPAAAAPAAPGPPLPQQPLSGAIQVPDDRLADWLAPAATLERVAPRRAPLDAGLLAIAIVGDVGGNTATYKNDMDGAVAALQNHGLTVTKFYYGDTTFGWSDIVAAAPGVHFLLYMGHGVYSGTMPYPTSVGGFYLGPSKYVSSNQIRTDLNGVLAADSLMIFSHACFTAGSAGGDPPDLEQSEAERRVRLYADPFTDIGMKAYFANNYFNSAARTVNLVMGGSTMENVFKGGTGYQASRFVDLTYAEPGYDFWLDGTTGEWSLSFVGIPAYVFAPDLPPDADAPVKPNQLRVVVPGGE
ncbi:MAG: hypothetical protein JXR37_03615 [Kiritimatiellae bacterium]|nr:hypothetical protein [Kiritimatiellia bacterium]